MLNQKLSKLAPALIIYVVITSLFLGALFITIWFSKTSYSSLVDFIIQTLKRPDLKPLIIKSLFTNEKYEQVYKLHWILYPIIIIVSGISYYKSEVIYKSLLIAIHCLRISFLHVIIFFKNLQKKEKLLLGLGCCLYVALVLYNNHLKEISYDEAWAYNYYINKPFYFPLILFNTYPLYNLITHFFTFLPFDTLINIRLPSLLFGIFTLLALFYTLYKQQGFFSAGLGLLALSASPLFFIYSSLSRGITLSLFLSVIVLHLTIKIVTGNSFTKRYRFLYIISNFLGIASMPTFFVYTISASLFLILRKHKQKAFVKTILQSAFIIFLASFIFYLPVLFASGPALIYHNNHYVFNIADTMNKAVSFLFGLSQLFFVSKYVVMLLLFISLALLFSKPLLKIKKVLVTYSLFVIMFTLLARAVTGNIFPERSLNYLILFFIIILIHLTDILLHSLSYWLKVTVSLALFVLFSFSYIHNQKELLRPAEDKDAKIIGELLIKNEVKTAYINEDNFWVRIPMIEYYYSKKNKQISFATSSTTSTRYLPFNIYNNYDCIVSRPSFAGNIKSLYKEIYRNSDFAVWKKLPK